MTTANRRFKVLQIGKFYPPHRGGMESHLKMLCDQIRPDVDVERWSPIRIRTHRGKFSTAFRWYGWAASRGLHLLR